MFCHFVVFFRSILNRFFVDFETILKFFSGDFQRQEIGEIMAKSAQNRNGRRGIAFIKEGISAPPRQVGSISQIERIGCKNTKWKFVVKRNPSP